MLGDMLISAQKKRMKHWNYSVQLHHTFPSAVTSAPGARRGKPLRETGLPRPSPELGPMAPVATPGASVPLEKMYLE